MIHELSGVIFLWLTRPSVNWPDTGLQKNKYIVKNSKLELRQFSKIEIPVVGLRPNQVPFM